MLFSLVWVLAGITAWCVASLALALIVGPMIRASDRADRAARRQLRPSALAAPVSLNQ
ncbi:MAG: hypothetical protein QOE37_1268 [Microbacteriaceae bacterium]|jgi:hypothetical protein|nr:hypothetical protein [Microbacteriaceae bacterium]